jgi:anti-sigma regulatory factor (Ser/Thr protein kinase)
MMPPECVVHMPLRACTFRFAGRVDQVGRARSFVAGFLEKHPGADDAVLLVSELAANACAHSASGRPGGGFEVRVVVGVEGWVRVEVEDQGSSWDGRFANIASPHGLYLLRALSDQCGARPGACGWVTWFVLGRP